MPTAVKPKSDKQIILAAYDAYALGLVTSISRHEESGDRIGRERAKETLACWEALRKDALAGRFD